MATSLIPKVEDTRRNIEIDVDSVPDTVKHPTGVLVFNGKPDNRSKLFHRFGRP